VYKLYTHRMTDSSWDQEILRILGEQAFRGIVTMSIREILNQIKSSQIKRRVTDLLETKGIGNVKDIVAVNLRLNPGLYALFQNETYEKYVRVDEGNGLVFLDKSANPLVSSYRGDIGLDGFLFIKTILEQIANHYAFGKFIEIAKDLKPPNQNPQKWTGDIVREGEKFSVESRRLIDRITELIEFRVRVRDFKDTIDRIINDYSNLLRDMTMFCSKVLKESEDRNLLDQAIFVFSLYRDAASSVYGLSVKWKIDVEPPFTHTADFISIIISTNFRVQSKQNGSSPR
jgi:hypothetical protein